MPSKKKNQSSWKLKAFVIVIIFILTASYALSFLNFGSGAALPPASSFVAEDWMNFLPEGASYSRFLNYTDLEDLTDMFPDTVALYLWDIGYNLSVFDVNYELYMTINETDVLALNLNSSMASFIEISYYLSNQSVLPFNGIPVFLINDSRSNGVAWIAVYNNTVLYSEGNATAWIGISKVISAKYAPLFNNDDYKIGHLLASKQQHYFAMYFFYDADPSLQIDWAMIGLSNAVSPVQRQVFHFESSAIASSQYNAVASKYFSNPSSALLVGSYIYGDA